MWLKRLDKGLALPVLLFIVVLPLVWQITFPQNDDWVYYRMVRQFMAGDFRLDPISAPTFYTQGVLGAAFAFLFGLPRLPVLTLLVSVINCYLVYTILGRSTKLGPRWSALVALGWFVSPLNVYSTLGFMTENYLLLCILASLYFFTLYTISGKVRHLVLCNMFLVFGLFTKQAALTLAVSLPAYFLVTKRWRLFALQTAIAVALCAFYFLVFPKTPEMAEKPLQFHHLVDIDYLKQLTRAIIIYCTAFCFPLLAFALPQGASLTHRKRLAVWVVLLVAALLISWVAFRNFKPNRLGWQEFFYLDNTLERTGFYPRGVMGTKFYFKGNYDLYTYWDRLAKVLAGFMVVGLSLSVTKLKRHAHLLVFLASYGVLMLLAEKVYDRYLPPLFLAVTLLLTANFAPAAMAKATQRLCAGVLAAFVVLCTLYSYQFALDFVLVNKYIWTRSEQLVAQEHIAPKLIKGTNAWKLTDYNVARNYLYDFTFDAVSVNKRYGAEYTLVERHRVDFPGSLFVEPYIYLYKKLNFVDVVL